MGTAVIAPFGRDRVREWVRAPRLPMLFDRASVTARTFGVYDPVTTNPRPGAFLIDQRGRIVWLISGGLPSASELVRMTGEALEAQREEMGAAAGKGPAK
jgi:alkyl hydroperoxide reductase subunit AhpC